MEQLEEARVTGWLCSGEWSGWGDTESGSLGPDDFRAQPRPGVTLDTIGFVPAGSRPLAEMCARAKM